MASGGLLSLKWNNHKTTFFHVLSTIRSKEAYCDATIACDGRFYPVHKLIMSTCSDYFEEMFERTNCKHPVIVLKDIRHEDLEALLNYMYVGEVNVLQNELAGLIKAAECLMIKGLAVPDEAPNKDSPRESKRGATKVDSPQAKRRRHDDSDSGRYNSSSSNSGRSSSQNQSNRESTSSSNQQEQFARHSSSASGQSSSFRRPTSSPHHTPDSLPDDPGTSQNSNQDDNFHSNSEKSRSQDMPSSQAQKHIAEVVLDEPSGVKEEPEEIQEVEEVQEDIKHVLESSFSYEHMSEGDSMSNVGDGASQGAQMMSGAPQSMEELVAQAMPGSSGMDGNSLWESEGSLQGFPAEAFGDAQRAPQMGEASKILLKSDISTKDVLEPIRLHPGHHLPLIIGQDRSGKNLYRECHFCKSQTEKSEKQQQMKRSQRTHIKCTLCDVALCHERCFFLYHTVEDFTIYQKQQNRLETSLSMSTDDVIDSELSGTE